MAIPLGEVSALNPKRRISTLITDLDNTLYDWVAVWHASFSAMLASLLASSGVDQSELEREIRMVHQKYGTSEYAFLIQELPILAERHPGEDLAEVYAEAINAYRTARRDTMAAYPTVVKTLERIRDYRCTVVAYTESMAFYSNDRIRRLGLACD